MCCCCGVRFTRKKEAPGIQSAPSSFRVVQSLYKPPKTLYHAELTLSSLIVPLPRCLASSLPDFLASLPSRAPPSFMLCNTKKKVCCVPTICFAHSKFPPPPRLVSNQLLYSPHSLRPSASNSNLQRAKAADAPGSPCRKGPIWSRAGE
jgi:hypothetical protein